MPTQTTNDEPIFQTFVENFEYLSFITILILDMKIIQQWHIVGFWHPGQEVKLVPLFLIFSKKIQNDRPKTNLGHFQMSTIKPGNGGVQNCLERECHGF